MVATAGYLLGVVGGAADWETLVAEKIFAPLGLRRTFANFSDSIAQPNRATPMVLDDDTKQWRDEPYAMNLLADIGAAPAASIATNIDDALAWLLAHLGHADLLSAESLQFLHSPKMTMPEDDSMPSWLFQRVIGANYAMNWSASTVDKRMRRGRAWT